MSLEKILIKWDEARAKLELLEEKLKKYKTMVSKEMDRKEVDKISIGAYTVTRRRNVRSTITKDNVPDHIWKEFATKSSYDAFFLVKSK